MAPSKIIELEDRVLVLQDQVDSLFVKVGYDPSQPRDKDGQWSEAGGGSSGGSSPSSKSWATVARVRAVVDQAYAAYKPKAKEAMATVAANLITAYNNNDADTEAIKQSLLDLSTNINVSASQTRDQLIKVLQKLKEARMKDLTKAAEDPIVKAIDSAIAALRALDLGDEEERLTKVEDTLLELQDKVDCIKGKVNGNSQR